MAEERKGDRAYLLITFDLAQQQMLSTEEVVGPPEGERHAVKVDWVRLIGTIKKKHVAPKDPPWDRAVVDEDYKPPSNTSVESHRGR